MSVDLRWCAASAKAGSMLGEVVHFSRPEVKVPREDLGAVTLRILVSMVGGGCWGVGVWM
jgi:hypothetical protein